MLKIVSTLFALIFLVLGVLLGILNPSPVSFDYYFNQVQMPLSVLLGGFLILGVLLTLIYSLWNLVVLNLKVRSLQRKNNKQLNELIELRKAKDEADKQIEALQQELDEQDKKQSDLIMLADNSTPSNQEKS